MSDDKLISSKATITLRSDVLEELDKMASDWGLSRSGMITTLVKMRLREDAAMGFMNNSDLMESISKLANQDKNV